MVGFERSMTVDLSVLLEQCPNVQKACRHGLFMIHRGPTPHQFYSRFEMLTSVTVLASLTFARAATQLAGYGIWTAMGCYQWAP